jgi:Domain of unknown function (DUF4160)
MTGEQYVRIACELSGRPYRLQVPPRWMLSFLGVFVPVLRESNAVSRDAPPARWSFSVWTGHHVHFVLLNPHAPVPATRDVVCGLFCASEPDGSAREGIFRFYFSSREEKRAHVHVQHADGEAKFWIEPTVECTRTTVSRPGEALPRLKSRTCLRTGSGCSSASRSCSCRSRNSRGSRTRRLARSAAWSCRVRITCAGPDLDIDLAVDSRTHPERYPLVSQVPPKRLQPTKARRRAVTKPANRPRARG